MHMLKDTKSLAVTALMAAFTCIATMSIRIPTPTLGYIHPGDCLVLLCGVILGPVAGFLAAGIGSMFADILSGYIIYAIPTLIIKGVTALIAAVLFRRLKQIWNANHSFLFIAAGIPAELNRKLQFRDLCHRICKRSYRYFYELRTRRCRRCFRHAAAPCSVTDTGRAPLADSKNTEEFIEISCMLPQFLPSILLS